ncbi:conserved hypothetical protein [Desulfamplus magnetovallimortis]|uniref:Addiction module killer protein n=1 Tax=Desulfamplus magnetovallimortis TaxID=1246637 RepID=A0A1W1HI78_9BACT|nr:type II toxin-antitoxin system RelE/ParE family toxin [Desulfamplus magnetovallimortis]SLM32133.1 conserved hypothetical protein [Desulfamplus magnetovallimortis]
MKKIVHYITSDGKSIFQGWFRTLRDRRAKINITKRLTQAKKGSFGDTKSIGDGVHEMRINYGPGYRVYYANDLETIIVLLCGGDKSTQDEDIKTAKKYWAEYKQEKKR